RANEGGAAAAVAARRERLIRPLLFATKAEILHFAGMENIAFREDSSNLSVKYARNLIRHSVMPAFQKINPAFQKSAGETLAHLRDAEALYDFALAVIWENVLTIQGNEHRIEIAKLLSYPAPTTVLFELLKPLNFNSDQVAQILQSLENQPGKLFYSPTHKLLLDRLFLVAKSGEDVGGGLIINAISPYPISVPDGTLSLQIQTEPPFTIPQSPTPVTNHQSPITSSNWSICLDFDKLNFPLTLRRWQPGDVFCPLGMDGKHKKLQDFFTDRKLSRFEKEQVWLLESDGKICWVVGMALDERFKVLPETKTCLVASFEQDTFAAK
ncbi:MAG: tRNA lysidine(34) synthetase TilS, partial [Bacteroidota bacterium]